MKNQLLLVEVQAALKEPIGRGQPTGLHLTSRRATTVKHPA